jgi:hypothetical protein
MPTAIRPIALLTTAAILIGFVWLLLHNQSQTEYLIYFDFWRNYNVLAGNGSFDEYLFHDVHTYAVASLAWYFDAWLAGGSLKLLHAIVLGATAAIFVCLAILALRLFRPATVPTAYAFVTAAGAMALWLSPSNSVGLTYPVLDIIASSLLLSLSLAAIIAPDSGGVQMRGATRRLREIGYLCVAVVGFFSFETFVAAPLFLALDAVLRRNYRDFLLHVLTVSVLLALYFALRERPVLSPSSPAFHWDYLAFAHNFAMFLSMHVLMLLHALKVEPGTAANFAMMASAVQLIALALFAGSHYSGSARFDPSPRFAISFAVVGIISIALATWLRNSSGITTDPVPRYTPYAMLLSMGVFFLSARALVTPSGRLLRGASFLAILALSSYLLADIFAFSLRSYNPADTFAQSRLEMPVYASSPGSEILLGPSEPDGGLAFRSNLHSFLSTRELSVFGSAGYLGLGHPLPPTATAANARCSLLGQQAAPGQRPQYTLATFRTEGVSGNGIFLAADAVGTIVGFGFAAKLHPAETTVQALLPKPDEASARFYYAQVRGANLVTAVPCH